MAIFDKVATHYDSWYQEIKGQFVDRVESDLAFKLFKAKRGMHILDVGCGTGNFSIKLAQIGCRVTAVDVSENMLQIARTKVKQKHLDISFHKMDAYDLQFAENNFDGVLSMAAFEFIDRPKCVLQEMMRVVKNDGQIVVGTISSEGAWGKYYKKSAAHSIFKHATFHTLDDMKSWCPSKLSQFGECLYVSPNAPVEAFTLACDRPAFEDERGSFICAKWIKK